MSLPGHLVAMGAIIGVHGIRGEVKIKSFTAKPLDIGRYGALVTRGGQTVELHNLRETKDGVIARIRGVTDRDAAGALRGVDLLLSRAQLPELAEGEFYHADLIGLQAFGADGAVLGSVIAIANFGAGDLLDVALAGQKPSETRLIALKNMISADLGAGRIVIDVPAEVE